MRGNINMLGFFMVCIYILDKKYIYDLNLNQILASIHRRWEMTLKKGTNDKKLGPRGHPYVYVLAEGPQKWRKHVHCQIK